MSGDSAELRNASLITAPFAGFISVLSVSNVAASQDLSLLGPQKVDPDLLNDIVSNIQRQPAVFGLAFGMYARFTAVGTTVSVLFGATQAAVTGGNAPNTATTGVNTAGCCEPIAVGTSVDLWISTNTRWLGFIGAGNGTLVIRPSSRGANG